MAVSYEPRIVVCRHCNSKNRIRPMEAEINHQEVTCGHCGQKLFFGELDYFKNLSSVTYEHTLDRQALRALRRVPGINSILRFVLREISERQMRMLFMQAFVKVTPDHMTPLYEKIVYASKVLDLPVPEFYVMQSPVANAMTIGVDKPFVAVTTALLDLLDEKQILGVIAHELGHIHAGHALYRTALNLIVSFAFRLLGGSNIFGGVAMLAIYQALMYWSRCAELTADRAQMLVQRDFRGFVTCEMKLAGGSDYTNELLEYDKFLEQGDEAARMKEENFLNQIFATQQEARTTHPFPVWRAGHMHRWVAEGEYLSILAGHYTQRQEGDAQPDPFREGDEASEEGEEPTVVRKFLDEIRNVLRKD